ncbi:Tn7-like element transposition protein TnsE [Halomonas piscis]|uniref:Tn7-like element transposition protein TnsE n=1 Tax=Halomonas piscis TaxID=3031727 RepID=A0ABY9Z1V4_9GAMM|nr:Tn7-like element transposition protein TnsE [Halomonas piscis]WNK20254.1 Tn7-like element transposition protein TnsE [Halomonas piscis]
MNFKEIENNSRIREIGSIYRRLDNSDWRIEVKLDPRQKKESFSISQLTALARRRVLNAVDNHNPAGYKSSITIGDTTQWEHRQIGECPITSVAKQGDRHQWSFCFESNDIVYYLPQIELARVLFFHYAYLSRLAMIPGGLSEEFDIQENEAEKYAKVNILPTSSLPKYVRESLELRRLLAWVLLDKDARRSFESISSYQLKEGSDVGNYRRWSFRFDPPVLNHVSLKLCGHFDRDRRAFFVYEIHDVKNLVHTGPEQIEFFDPGFRTPMSAKGVGAESNPRSAEQPLIDDEELPKNEGKDLIFQLPSINFSFSNPTYTTRTGMGNRLSSRTPDTSEAEESQNLEKLEFSTDERTIRGQLPSAVFNVLEDHSDDLHHYIHRFEAFAEMVEVLQDKGCVILESAIKKLPAMAGFSKFLMTDGNPRCLAFRLLRIRGQNFVLLEVDTSDSKTKLSTLLLKQPSTDFDWKKELYLLEKLLVKSSLVWPKKYLDEIFPSHYDRIPHPRTNSFNKTFLEPHSIRRWADRLYSYLN